MIKIICKILLCFFLGLMTLPVLISAQQTEFGTVTSHLPSLYFKLKSDTDRMHFLMKAIEDSLNEGQLNHVMQWAHFGLAMAKKNNTDTMKGIFLFDIGKAFAYKYNKFDSAIFYYKTAIYYFPDRHNKYNLLSTREIMDRYSDLGNKDSSFVWLNMLSNVIDTMPDTSPIKSRYFQNIALVYQGFGLNKTAIRYYQIAINGTRQNKNFRGLGMALANLGELYNQTGNTEKAIKYSKEGMTYLADVNMPYMQTAGNISEYYIAQSNYDSATRYLNISQAVAKKINDFETQLVNQNRLALIFIAKKEFTEAKKLLDKSLLALSGTENYWNKCITLLDYAVLDTATGNFANAKLHLIEAVEIALKNNFKAFTVPAFKSLSTVYEKLRDYKSALDYHKQYVDMKDSLADEKTTSELADLDVSYKTQQKENEIELLKKDNDIKRLEISNNNKAKAFFITALISAVFIFSILYYQRSRRNEIETKKIKAELENEVLRAQMNPHFIFNSLNSIENFIMKNEKRLASDYLNKFARLIRMILDSSLNGVVPIAKDMEALQLYIDLEQLRFNNKFSYSTIIDPILLNGDYKIPSLLIQPYVENAIVHGLSHSDDLNLFLSVTAQLKNNNIIYTITDNGIGRLQAAIYKEQNKPFYKSVGLHITEERIKNFNRHPGKDESVLITDLYNSDGTSAGTKIEITLKAV